MITLTIEARDEDEAAEILAAVKAVRCGRRTRRRREVTEATITPLDQKRADRLTSPALSLPLDTAAGAR